MKKMPLSAENLVDEPNFIHFSYDDYSPIFLHKLKEQNNFEMIRMAPPGKVCYFFTTGDK